MLAVTSKRHLMVIAIHILTILGNMWYTELHPSSEVIDDDRLAMVATVTWKYHFRHGPINGYQLTKSYIEYKQLYKLKSRGDHIPHP